MCQPASNNIPCGCGGPGRPDGNHPLFGDSRQSFDDAMDKADPEVDLSSISETNDGLRLKPHGARVEDAELVLGDFDGRSDALGE